MRQRPGFPATEAATTPPDNAMLVPPGSAVSTPPQLLDITPLLEIESPAGLVGRVAFSVTAVAAVAVLLSNSMRRTAVSPAATTEGEKLVPICNCAIAAFEKNSAKIAAK